MVLRGYRTWIYALAYCILVATRFWKGLTRSAADSISRASLEVANLGAIVFCAVAEEGAKGRIGERFTYGRRRLHVLAGLVMCVVISVNFVLNLSEVLDDLSWLPDKESLWEKKEVNLIQALVGLLGMLLFRRPSNQGVKRAEDVNRKGVHLHALYTFVDAFVTLVISFFTTNHHRASLHLNFVGSLATGLGVIASALPFMRFVVETFLHVTPVEQANALNKRLAQLAKLPGMMDCTDVHFWIETTGINVCTMRLRVGEDADEQAILSSAFDVFDDLLDDLTVEIVTESSN